MAEQDIFIASTGQEYRLTLASTKRTVLSDEGTGMPPVEYITERGPFQHGESLRSFYLRPRTVQYVLRQKFCDRNAYWRGRSELLTALRPTGAGTLRKILGDGRQFDLSVNVLEGPRFEARNPQVWDEWAFQEVIRFIAHDPVYYDPLQRNHDFLNPIVGCGFTYTFPFTFCEPAQLVFPTTFPIAWSGFDVGGTDGVDVEYRGNWEEYPDIFIYGPCLHVIIENLSIGEKIDITGLNLLAGESIHIALSYGSKTATHSNGGIMLSYITEDSDLTSFRLQPGENKFRVRVVGDTIDTHVNMTWYDRYVGI